ACGAILAGDNLTAAADHTYRAIAAHDSMINVERFMGLKGVLYGLVDPFPIGGGNSLHHLAEQHDSRARGAIAGDPIEDAKKTGGPAKLGRPRIQLPAPQRGDTLYFF